MGKSPSSVHRKRDNRLPFQCQRKHNLCPICGLCAEHCITHKLRPGLDATAPVDGVALQGEGLSDSASARCALMLRNVKNKFGNWEVIPVGRADTRDFSEVEQ